MGGLAHIDDIADIQWRRLGKRLGLTDVPVIQPRAMVISGKACSRTWLSAHDEFARIEAATESDAKRWRF